MNSTFTRYNMHTTNIIVIMHLLLLLFLGIITSSSSLIGSSKVDAATYYNVISFGAKADGVSDSTAAFQKVWSSACPSSQASTIYVPKGRYLLNAITFRGPCRNRIVFRIDGTIIAPANYWDLGHNTEYWILFIKVNRIMVVGIGGVLDARAQAYWACRRSGRACPLGARSVTFNWANNVLISGLTSIDSQKTHLVINHCNDVVVRNVKLYAPDHSPNTDGIHVQSSTGVTITGCSLHTGDDCISIGPGTRNMLMSRIKCGPGHGISIGSLARSANEDGVENITLTDSVFAGSDNGVRIKSWARPTNSFVRNVVFQNLVMSKVKRPIIIDQNYCPYNLGCPGQSSGVKIGLVTYKNIKGTSATEEAVTFDCSSTNPCTGIRLQDIHLTYMDRPATASCKNIIGGTTAGVLVPRSCL